MDRKGLLTTGVLASVGRVSARGTSMALIGVACSWISGATAQTAREAPDLATWFTGLTAVSGYEETFAIVLEELVPGVERDRAGSVVAVLGSGNPRRLAVCPMDEWGYVVGRIRDDGCLTLRRVGGGAPWTFDQSHEGHRLTVWGDRGPIPGVMAVFSTHLARGRARPTAPFTVDDAYVDVGASSGDEVRGLGIGIVNAVAMAKTVVPYGDSLLAGPEAGQRGSCAALARAVMDRPTVRGSVVVAFVVESHVGHRGLMTVANAHGPFEETFLLAYPGPANLPESLGRVERRGLTARYKGWPVETIGLRDVAALTQSLKSWMEGGR